MSSLPLYLRCIIFNILCSIITIFYVLGNLNLLYVSMYLLFWQINTYLLSKFCSHKQNGPFADFQSIFQSGFMKNMMIETYIYSQLL